LATKDLLERLFDVEREAEAIVAEARETAGKRRDAAKTSAQKRYTEAYDAALAVALAARESSERAAKEEYDAAIQEYRLELESSRLDEEAFAALCDSALGEGI
jgi:hypothetical protein